MKKDIKSMFPSEIAEDFKKLGLPSYRAKQVSEWLSKNAESFDEMLNLPQSFREQLDDIYYISTLKVAAKLVSKLDGTVKFLWQLDDGNCVESVVMKYKHGNTVCISSQVGCAMSCKFCASTIGGLVRNLTPSEILNQVSYSQKESGMKISNIVMMGIGEPLNNYDNVIRFLKLVNDGNVMNIGMRHISLSTCGIVENIDKLAELNLQLTLSVSLHAPDDETRMKIMPIDRKYGVDRLLDACASYFNKTGRRISFEYSMIKGVNDSQEHARLLAQKLKGTGSHINLIRINKIKESEFEPTDKKELESFKKILEDSGLTVTVRRTLGSDINASCGQLRREIESNDSNGCC